MIKIHDLARKHIQLSSDNMKFHHDETVNFHEYSVGDTVWFHNPVRKKGITLKLQRPWKGPNVVIAKYDDVVYKIQNGPRRKSKVVHYNRLKPYNRENKPVWFQR